MAFRVPAITAAAIAVVVGGWWAAGFAGAQPANPGPAAPFAGGCGVIAYPGTGARGVVKVASGSISCTDAMEIVDRYLHDRDLVHTGSTWAAEFDGWMCATPTAATAEEYGYLSSCHDQFGGEIRVISERDTGPSNICQARAADGILPELIVTC